MLTFVKIGFADKNSGVFCYRPFSQLLRYRLQGSYSQQLKRIYKNDTHLAFGDIYGFRPMDVGQFKGAGFDLPEASTGPGCD